MAEKSQQIAAYKILESSRIPWADRMDRFPGPILHNFVFEIWLPMFLTDPNGASDFAGFT